MLENLQCLKFTILLVTQTRGTHYARTDIFNLQASSTNEKSADQSEVIQQAQNAHELLAKALKRQHEKLARMSTMIEEDF